MLNISRLWTRVTGEDGPLPDGISARIADVLDTLTEREQIIIRQRCDEASWTLAQIANQHHVSRERIRQIEAKAFRKLRHPKRMRMMQGLPTQEQEDLSTVFEGASGKLELVNFLFLPIHACELSVRAANGLRNANKHSVYEVIVTSQRDLLKTRYFGVKSLAEVRGWLRCRGLDLGMSPQTIGALLRDVVEQRKASQGGVSASLSLPQSSTALVV